MGKKEYLTVDDVELQGKRVLVRVDFNVPLKEGAVEDDTRIRACLPTINTLLANKASVILMSHLGRPEEGKPQQQYSLAPVAGCLSSLIEKEVPLITNWHNGMATHQGDIVMLENIRIEVGEKANDDALAKQLAGLCDVYVNDAFATAHRAQASTHGVARFAPLACAGPLLDAELVALGQALKQPQRPMVSIVGGAKVSTKLTVLENLLDKVDQLIVGGGIANTFLLAKGYPIGRSLSEPDLIATAKNLIEKAAANGKDIPLPVDVVCGSEFSESTTAVVKKVADVTETDMIMDIGPDTAMSYAHLLDNAGTIVWNGPLGVFEFDQFSHGTRSLAQAIAQSDAFSIAGGGDTLSAISRFNVTDDISYISTGGGAFLELLEGRELPAVSILKTL